MPEFKFLSTFSGVIIAGRRYVEKKFCRVSCSEETTRTTATSNAKACSAYQNNRVCQVEWLCLVINNLLIRCHLQV